MRTHGLFVIVRNYQLFYVRTTFCFLQTFIISGGPALYLLVVVAPSLMVQSFVVCCHVGMRTLGFFYLWSSPVHIICHCSKLPKSWCLNNYLFLQTLIISGGVGFVFVGCGCPLSLGVGLYLFALPCQMRGGSLLLVATNLFSLSKLLLCWCLTRWQRGVCSATWCACLLSSNMVSVQVTSSV